MEDNFSTSQTIDPGLRKAYTGAIVLMAIAALSLGCASYRGTASSAQPSIVAQQG